MKILIAEDDPVSRSLLQKILEKKGHEVLSADDGIKAWELFKKRGPGMVITDWMMPQMDGPGLCRKIRSFDSDTYTYIVFLTAKAQKNDLVEVFDAGADDYITKPFDPEELRARIKTGERIVRLEEGHKNLESILLESRDKLRTVFDSLQEEIVSVDDNFLIVSVNRAFLETKGSSFKDCIGRPCFESEDERSAPVIENKIEGSAKMVFKTGVPEYFQDTSTDRHGDIRHREIKCLPIKSESGKIFQVVIVTKDVTGDRRKSEEIKALNKKLETAVNQIQAKNKRLEHTLKRLRETQAQMLQSDKMSSIGQLAAGVAHEINNPTGFVSSNLKTLSNYQNDIIGLIKQYRKLTADLKDAIAREAVPSSITEQMAQIMRIEAEVDINFVLDDIPDLIKDCKEGTERIKKIVLDLKDFAHPGEDRAQSADINKGIESTLNVVWNELKYKATVTKGYGDIPPVKCYSHQLNQVFMNLFVNATQAIEDKGEISISTRADNGHVEIKISDTGVGIPSENISKIFDPFFTTKEVGKGTGLGLNVAYNIIQKHKGTIEVESEVGKGTTFIIRLPF